MGLEDYHILELIGVGSFGKVYRGRRKFTGHIVALKFVYKRGKSAKDLQSLRDEINILRRLDHCNIIAIMDSFETEGEFCIVTEYAQGDLFQALEDDRYFPEEEIRKIAIQLIQALHVLHSNRIIHRDMKPQNILIGSKKQVKLCDFGFARAISHDASLLTSIKGTPLYMAPELVQQKPYTYTVDLWSLGVILYELAVGRPPFYTDRIVSLIQMIMHDPVEYPSSISPAFQHFLVGLLNKDPTRRLAWPAILKHPFVTESPEQLAARLALESQVRTLPRFFDETQLRDGSRTDAQKVKPSMERLRSCGEWKICDPETGQQVADAIDVPEHKAAVATRTGTSNHDSPTSPIEALSPEADTSKGFCEAWDEVQQTYRTSVVGSNWSEAKCVHRAISRLPELSLCSLSNDVASIVLSLLQLEYRLVVSLLKIGDAATADDTASLDRSKNFMHRFLEHLLSDWSEPPLCDAEIVGEVVYQCIRCCVVCTNVLNGLQAESDASTHATGPLNYRALCSGDISIISKVLKCKSDVLSAAHSKTLKWLGSMLDRSNNLTDLIEVVNASGIIESLCEILEYAERARSPGGRISLYGRDLGLFSVFALSAFVHPDGKAWGPLQPFPILCLSPQSLSTNDLVVDAGSARLVKQLYKLRVKVHGEVANQLLKSGLAELVQLLSYEVDQRRASKNNAEETVESDSDGDDEDESQTLICCAMKILVHCSRSSTPFSKKLALVKATSKAGMDAAAPDIVRILFEILTTGVARQFEKYLVVELLSVLLRRELLSKNQAWRFSCVLYPLLIETRDETLISAICTFLSDVIESEAVDSTHKDENNFSPRLKENTKALQDLIGAGIVSRECFQAVLRLFQCQRSNESIAGVKQHCTERGHLDARVKMLTCYHVRAQGLMDPGVVLLLRVASKVIKSAQGSGRPENDGDDQSAAALHEFAAVFDHADVWETFDELLVHAGYGILSPWGLFCLLKLMRMIREMHINSNPHLEITVSSQLLPHVVNLLDRKHIEHLFQWPYMVGGGANAVKALIYAIVKVIWIPFMHNVPEELLVSTQEALYDGKCVEKLLGVLCFASQSVREIHLEASALELPVSFLSRLVTSSEHFGAQFVDAGGIRVIKECGMLQNNSSPSFLIDTLLIVSQLARTSASNYDELFSTNLMPEIRDLLAHSEAMVRAKALDFIGRLCKHSTQFYSQLIECGRESNRTVLDLMIERLADSDGYVRRFACFAIGNAAFHDRTLYDALRPAIPLLVRNLDDAEDKTRSNAGAALSNLVRNSDELCEALCAYDAPSKLLQLALSESSMASRRIVLFSLGNFCVYPRCFVALHEADPDCVGRLEQLHDDVVGDEISRKNIRRVLAKIDDLIDYK